MSRSCTAFTIAPKRVGQIGEALTHGIGNERSDGELSIGVCCDACSQRSGWTAGKNCAVGSGVWLVRPILDLVGVSNRQVIQGRRPVDNSERQGAKQRHRSSHCPCWMLSKNAWPNWAAQQTPPWNRRTKRCLRWRPTECRSTPPS